jgi:hypothetical protein
VWISLIGTCPVSANQAQTRFSNGLVNYSWNLQHSADILQNELATEINWPKGFGHYPNCRLAAGHRAARLRRIGLVRFKQNRRVPAGLGLVAAEEERCSLRFLRQPDLEGVHGNRNPPTGGRTCDSAELVGAE